MRFPAALIGLSLCASVASADAPTPNCNYKYRLTNRTGDPTDTETNILVSGGVAVTPVINNGAVGCTGWILTTSSEGFSVASIVLQTAQRSYSAATLRESPTAYSTFSGTDVSGSLPITSTTSSSYIGYGYFPYIRISAALTGTGSVEILLKGWQSVTFAKGIGSGTGGDFVAGTTGNDFNISNSGGTTTVNLPTASATKRGALSSANWSTFNGKLNAVSTDVVGLFTGCSGTQYLGADGACHSAAGGSPGTPDGSLQYDNGGAFGGATNWSYDLTHKTIQVHPIEYPGANLTLALAGAGAGNVDDGEHCYTVAYSAATYYPSYDYITYPSGYNTITVVDKTTNGQVSITDIPVSSDSRTATRELYRSKAGEGCSDSKFYWLATISDNTTTTYVDNASDASLTVEAPAWFDYVNATGIISSSENPAQGTIITEAGILLNTRGNAANYGFASTRGVLYVPEIGYGNIVTLPQASGVLANDGSGGLIWNSHANIIPGTTVSLGGGALLAGQRSCADSTVTGVLNTYRCFVSAQTDPGAGVSVEGAYYKTTNTVTVCESAIVGLTPATTVFNVACAP